MAQTIFKFLNFLFLSLKCLVYSHVIHIWPILFDCFKFEAGSGPFTQGGLKLVMLLPQPSLQLGLRAAGVTISGRCFAAKSYFKNLNIYLCVCVCMLCSITQTFCLGNSEIIASIYVYLDWNALSNFKNYFYFIILCFGIF